MKVTRAQAQRNRETVVNTAAGMFRKYGVAGVGIADVMRESGLTHGGFYGQFSSKEALAGESCARALAQNKAQWEGIQREHEARHGGDAGEGWHEPARRAMIREYLSHWHRENPALGCTLAALNGDSTRVGGAVSAAFTDGFKAILPVMERVVDARRGEEARQRALATMAQMVGALVLARGVNDLDFAEEILAAARMALDADHLVPDLEEAMTTA